MGKSEGRGIWVGKTEGERGFGSEIYVRLYVGALAAISPLGVTSIRRCDAGITIRVPSRRDA